MSVMKEAPTISEAAVRALNLFIHEQVALYTEQNNCNREGEVPSGPRHGLLTDRRLGSWTDSVTQTSLTLQWESRIWSLKLVCEKKGSNLIIEVLCLSYDFLSFLSNTVANSCIYQLYWFSTSIHFLTNFFDKLIQKRFYIQKILFIYIRLVRMQDNIKHDTMFFKVHLTSPLEFSWNSSRLHICICKWHGGIKGVY